MRRAPFIAVVCGVAVLWPLSLRSATAQVVPAARTAEVQRDTLTIAQEVRRSRRTQLKDGALRIYVSPKGDDRATGLRSSADAGGIDGPVQTIVAAQQRARQATASMASDAQMFRSVQVIFEPGLYRVASPVVFDERDSGRPNFPVVYAAEQPGTVVWSGALTLSAARPNADPLEFLVPAQYTINWAAAQQLFVDGARAVLARQPNAGQYWFVQQTDPADLARFPPEGFRADPAARAWIGSLSESDKRRAVLNMYQSWTTGRHRITGVNARGQIAIAPQPRWPYLRFGRSQRFFIENTRSALDAVGEWFGEGSTVTYLPRESQRENVSTAELPVVDRLVYVGTKPSSGKRVEHLEFRGLDFWHTRYATPTEGLTYNQAATAAGAAVEVDRASAIVIDDCEFSHLGGYGVWFRTKVQNSQITRSVFSDLGAGGVRIGQTDTDQDTAATGSNLVAENVVVRTGAILPSAVGIWLGRSSKNMVVQNLIADTTYSAISVGWQWGYGGPTSGQNLIAGNRLLNIGLGNLSDLGAIYTLGESPGTVVRDNYIREVRGYREYGPDGRSWACGIYQDEGSSDTVVRDNVVVGTDSGGYCLHFGRRNVVASNVFAMGAQSEITLIKRDSSATDLEISENLIIPESESPLSPLALAPEVRYKGNRIGRAPSSPRSIDLSRCGAGCQAGPLRLSADRDDGAIRVEGDAGWSAKIRRVADASGPRWLTLSPAVRRSALAEQAPVAPTLAVSIDIAGAQVGTQPLGLVYRPEGDLSAIRVVEDYSGSNHGHCLLLADSSKYDRSFEPFAFATLGRTSGRWTARFSLLVDDRTRLVHEWRDASKPYKVGPSLMVTGNQVIVNGHAVSSIQAGTWLQFKVSANVDAGRESWELDINPSTGKAQRLTDIPNKTPGWNDLRWAGFISDAVVESKACISDIQIHPD